MSEEFLVKDTGFYIDESGETVVCGPPTLFTYYESSGELKRKFMREIIEIVFEDGSLQPVKGVYIDEKHLERLEVEESVENYHPGKHIKTTTLSLSGYEASLVTYTDRLQLAVREIASDSVLFTMYLDKIHYGSVMYLLDNLSTPDDFFELKDKIKELS